MGPSYDRFRALTSQLRTNITKLGVPSASAPSSNASSNQLNSASQYSEFGDSAQGNQPMGNHDGDGGLDTPVWRKRKSPGSGLSAGMGSFVGSVGSMSTSTNNNASNCEISNSTNVETSTRQSGSNGIPLHNELNGGLVRATRRATASVFGGTTALSGAASCLGPDEGRAKLNPLGFPIDHPLNKEGYRYVLVEPDKHAVGREQWDDCEHTAGKPIPGLFYRVFLSPLIVLSLSDRANHLKLHDSQLAVTGEKGYCMVRATHGVHSGTWYFEATITDQPEGAATRIGWSQVLGNLQAPCGYDKFSYSWRSRLGTVFHESRGKHYANEGYKKDDVIGCMIHLPSVTSPLISLENTTDSVSNSEDSKKTNVPVSSATSQGLIIAASAGLKTKTHYYLPETYKDRPLIKFRNSYYFEEKDEPAKSEKLLRPLVGSRVTFYRNGECMGTAFKDIYAGVYYPAISIYRAATVSLNFGPVFKFPPQDIKDWQPMTDRLVSAAVEQTVADLLFLVEKEGYVEHMIKSCSGGV